MYFIFQVILLSLKGINARVLIFSTSQKSPKVNLKIDVEIVKYSYHMNKTTKI